MDPKTGEIYQPKDDADQRRIEKELGRELEQVTDAEHAMLRPVPIGLRVGRLNKSLGLPAHADRKMRRQKRAQLRRQR